MYTTIYRGNEHSNVIFHIFLTLPRYLLLKLIAVVVVVVVKAKIRILFVYVYAVVQKMAYECVEKLKSYNVPPSWYTNRKIGSECPLEPRNRQVPAEQRLLINIMLSWAQF